MQRKKRKKNSLMKTLQKNSVENTVLNEKSECLINAARHLNCLYSSDISPAEWFENNYEAQKAAKEVLNISINDSIPSEYCNSNNVSAIVTFGAEEYILPAQSRFYRCDIQNVAHLNGRKYDLIVLDPPWENKSVRRRKRYATLGCESLIDLPIEELCNPGCLIVIWITNNSTQLNFIKEKLFPTWKILNPVTWHWIKITQKGHFIHPIDWHHKKPYENLLLGHTVCNSTTIEPPAVSNIEPDKIILSVPSSIHSHKPPLVEILKPYIPEHANCLELFARYLLPGWTSLGNEVLKLQNIKLFERTS